MPPKKKKGKGKKKKKKDGTLKTVIFFEFYQVSQNLFASTNS